MATTKDQAVAIPKPKPRPIFKPNNCEKCIFYSLDKNKIVANRILHQPNNFYCTLRKMLIEFKKDNDYTCPSIIKETPPRITNQTLGGHMKNPLAIGAPGTTSLMDINGMLQGQLGGLTKAK